MDSVKRYEVSSQQLCWRCDMADLGFECTEELAPPVGFIGQDRALGAIQLGLEVDKPGYNLFVTGLTGTGKASAIKQHLQKVIVQRKAMRVPLPIHDWCYLYNFVDADRPRMLRLPPGWGKRLDAGLKELFRTLREEIPKVFASEDYGAQRKQVEEEGRAQHQSISQEMERKVRAERFGLQISPERVNLFPLTKEGKPIAMEDYMTLGEQEKSAIEEKRGKLMEQVEDTMQQHWRIEKDTREKLRELDRTVGERRLSDFFHDLLEASKDLPEVSDYAVSLKAYSLDNLPLFTDSGAEPPTTLVPGELHLPRMGQRNPFLPFEVNVLVDNSSTQVAPIIIESNPTWVNLFGRIERQAHMGAYFSDHMMLKAGSMHQANGGYLVLNIHDLMLNPGVWEGLKRAIRDREVRLEDPFVQFGLMPPQGLRPQPIPWHAKVIVTADEAQYRLLSVYDQEDFWEMFKVKAEFDFQIDLNPENIASYCAFICGISQAEGLLHADRSGVAKILEYGARLVADQTKLSSRFGQIKDLIIEADYWARSENSPVITGNHVKRALDEKTHRLNLVEERIRHLISEGTLMVDVKGQVVGQVNGLSVYDLGDFSFGRPSRITARTFAGRRGVVNIEREAQLSGRIHDKGVLILSGYLGWKFAQDTPLSLSASLCFEQSYEGVEGDSASSTELYAILSSLAGLPMKQGLAVTGSVNQNGEIQAIGGVNQKVEGFFDVCRAMGLSGEQGVIIPHQDIKHLMLRDDVVDTVKEGRFHIYAVKNVDEGIEVLTGVPAGEREPDGSYPEGSVNYMVDRRLKELARSLTGYYAEVFGGPA